MLFQTSGNMAFSAVTVLNKICPSLVDIRIFDKVILENGGMLLFIPDCYNYQAMYNKAVDSFGHALEYVPDCCKTKKNVIKLSARTLLQYNIFLIN